MSLISSNIPNLINGVSQQPPSLRLGSQAEEQVNGLSDVVTGLTKRPPTEHLGTITGDLSASKIHTYKRDENEQYTVIVSDGAIRVLNQDGVELDVELEDGADYSYITGINAEEDIRITSIADFSFILNTKKVVLKSDDIVPPARPFEALVYLKQVNYSREYGVKLETIDEGATVIGDLTSASTTGDSTDDANLKTSTVIEELRDGIKSTTDSDSKVFGLRSLPRGSTTAEYTARKLELRTLEVLPTFLPTDLTRVSVTTDKHGLLDPSYYTVDTVNNEVVISESLSDYVTLEGNGRSSALVWQAPKTTIYINATDETNVQESFSITPSTYAGKEPMFVLSSLENDFEIYSYDDNGGRDLKAFKGTAKNFTDLPNQAVNGFELAVVGDNNKDEDNFHVKFTGTIGQGTWQETVKSGIQNDFDTSTMPHRLEKFISDGTDGRDVGEVFWKFGATPFLGRKAGDDETNPFPSFVGNTINDIFFHRNRLGFLSDENVIFSEASGFYNFFRTTVRALLDSAPIDVAVSNDSVSILKAAIPYSEQLLLFSDLAQFNLTSGNLLTPTEVAVNVATNYEADLRVRPVSAGNSVFFANDKGASVGIREYFVANQTELNVADDVTSNIPTYIKGNITGMVTSSNEDTLLVTTDNDPKTVYVYRWYIAGNEKAQSSWSKWTFTGDILDMSFNNSEIFFLFDHGDMNTLEKINLSEDTAVSLTASKHPVLLDRRVLLNSASDTVPYTDSNVAYMDMNGKDLSSPSTYPVYAGVPYTFSYTFSEQVFKTDPSKPITIARYQLRNFNIVYSNTSTFDVTVTSTGRDPKSSTFTGNLLGASSFVLGTANIVPNGTYKVGIQSQASETDVTISSASALPCNFTSVEVEGFVTIRSQRI